MPTPPYFYLNLSLLLLGHVAMVAVIKLMYILVDNAILDSPDFIRIVKHPHLLSTRTQIVNIIKFYKPGINETLL